MNIDTCSQSAAMQRDLIIYINRMKSYTTSGPNRKLIKEMFDSIAGNYDLLNRILSFGVDNLWRKRGLSLFAESNKELLLDLGCGTGDLSRLSYNYDFKNVVGADFSMEMLVRGARKNKKFPDIMLCNSDAENLPFKNSLFSSCCIAFAIRNFQNREKALREISRVLRNKGQLMIIEFSMPENLMIRTLYKIYFFNFLPFIGGLISGNFRAYKYLPRSVDKFIPVDKFSRMILNNGFSDVKTYRLSFGIAYIYMATR